MSLVVVDKPDPIVQEGIDRGMHLWGMHLTSLTDRRLVGDAFELRYVGWDNEPWLAAYDQTSNKFLVKRHAQNVKMAYANDFVQYKTPSGTYRQAKVVQSQDAKDPFIFISRDKDDPPTTAVSSSYIMFSDWEGTGWQVEFLPRAKHQLKQEAIATTRPVIVNCPSAGKFGYLVAAALGGGIALGTAYMFRSRLVKRFPELLSPN